MKTPLLQYFTSSEYGDRRLEGTEWKHDFWFEQIP